MKTCILITVLFIGVCLAQPELSQAIELVNNYKYDEANKLIDDYLKNNAGDHSANFIKALILTRFKDFKTALTYIEKAISLKSDRAEYYQVSAQLYETLEKTKLAISAWEKCLAHSKDSRLFAEAKNHLAYLKKE